jgi:hypothetical protein
VHCYTYHRSAFRRPEKDRRVVPHTKVQHFAKYRALFLRMRYSSIEKINPTGVHSVIFSTLGYFHWMLFSWGWLWRLRPPRLHFSKFISGLDFRTSSQKFPSSLVRAGSLIRLNFYPEDGGNMFMWHVEPPPNYTALQPKIPFFSYSLIWYKYCLLCWQEFVAEEGISLEPLPTVHEQITAARHLLQYSHVLLTTVHNKRGRHYFSHLFSPHPTKNGRWAHRKKYERA